MQIRQGDIFLADLNPIRGHEQAGFRPVLVLQNNTLNHNLNTVVIAPLTTNLSAKGLLTTFFIEKKNSGLKYDSIILLFQIRTLDKARLEKKVRNVSEECFAQIKDQFKFIF